MKDLHKHSFAALALIGFSLTLAAQPFHGIGPNSASLSVAGNTYAFAYSSTGLVGGETLFGLYFNATTPNQGYEFRDGAGQSLVSVKATPGAGREPGDLIFGNTGSLIVKPNRYAFRFSLTPRYGLYFNAADSEYQFLNGVDDGTGMNRGSVVFGIDANTGDTYSEGFLSGSGSSALGDFAIKGTGGNPVTNGYLGVVGAVDFDGITGLGLSGDEIGVVGVSTGLSVGDNYGVYGYSNNIGVSANHATSGNSVDLATSSNALEAVGNAVVSGDVGIGTLSPATTLHINSTNAEMARFQGGGISNFISFYQGATRYGILWNLGNSMILRTDDPLGSIVFQTNGSASRMTIDETGNVGIGTTSPSEVLDVVGNCEVTGNVDVTGDAEITGNLAINATPSASFDLRVGSTNGSTIRLGTVEDISDGGTNTIEINANFDPEIFANVDLGASDCWDDVFANAFIVCSDRRLKENISGLPYGIKELMQLRPVIYDLKDNPGKTDQLGLIAQDVLPVIEEVVIRENYTVVNEESGEMDFVERDRMAINYTALIPVLIHAVQEQQVELDAKNKKVIALESRLAALEAKINRLIADLNPEVLKTDSRSPNLEISPSPDEFWLGQNVPNPFEESTTIPYRIPETAQNALIKVFDLEGREIASFILSNGQGQLTLNLGELSSGTYVCSLFSDNVLIQSRQLVIR